MSLSIFNVFPIPPKQELLYCLEACVLVNCGGDGNKVVLQMDFSLTFFLKQKDQNLLFQNLNS
jgi:hypothetical protein